MSSRMMQSAAGLIGLSAIFNLLVPVLSGFSADSLMWLPIVMLSAVLAWLVGRDKRWAAWLGFFVMLLGGIAGMAAYLGAGASPVWVSLGIWVTSWLAALCLFIVLWRDQPIPVKTEAQQH